MQSRRESLDKDAIVLVIDADVASGRGGGGSALTSSKSTTVLGRRRLTVRFADKAIDTAGLTVLLCSALIGLGGVFKGRYSALRSVI